MSAADNKALNPEQTPSAALIGSSDLLGAAHTGIHLG